MRSRSKRSTRFVRFALLVAMSATASLVVAQQADPQQPTQAEIKAALDKLRADPNLSAERKTRTLRWKSEAKKPEEKSTDFLKWIGEFFSWLGQLSRVFVWIAGSLLALLLGWFLFSLIKSFRAGPKTAAETLPTHVRDLDIRPESLPDDIGVAALDLWQRGDHRAALALLYRGLLSRLVHAHRVPIRDSSTEGDCLALAGKHLQAQRREFVGTLIRVWQRAIYGGQQPGDEEVRALCDGFAAALGPATSERVA